MWVIVVLRGFTFSHGNYLIHNLFQTQQNSVRKLILIGTGFLGIANYTSYVIIDKVNFVPKGILVTPYI